MIKDHSQRVKVADSLFDQHQAFFAYPDGNVYLATHRLLVNHGPVQEFILKVRSGRIRAKLIEEKTELEVRG